MLEELQRRNYSQLQWKSYLHCSRGFCSLLRQAPGSAEPRAPWRSQECKRQL